MEQQILEAGTVVAGRFEILSLAGEGDLGLVYMARDQEKSRKVALRVMPKSLISSADQIEKLRTRIKAASKLNHQNIRKTYGMGSEKDRIFISMEWIDGQNLRSLLTKRMEGGKRFSFKGAYNLMGHVCNALEAAHPALHHGAIGPRTIMISDAGRVKLADFGLSEFRISLREQLLGGKIESTFWSPEALDANGKPDYRSDIFSLGALFYELVTGVPPARPLKAPSLLGFSGEVDKVVARCMAADPAQRYPDVGAVKKAIADLVEKESAPKEELNGKRTDDNLGIDVEVDLTGLDGSPAPQTPQTPKAPPAPTAQAPVPPRQPDARPSAPKASSMLNAPGLPPPPANAGKASGDSLGGSPGRASTIDMGAVLSSLGHSESAHWMVQKDKFDHGPFTDREMVQMIMMGEVMSTHMLLNTDDGVRKKVRAWHQFDEYLERYRLKKKEEDEKLALERTVKAETRGSAFKWLIALGAVGVIAISIGGYFLSRTLRKEKQYSPEEIQAAFDSGKIKLKTGGSLISKKPTAGKGRRPKGGKGGMYAEGLSYEEAMNMGVDLGDMAGGGGQQQLTPQQITQIMDRNVRVFLPCMGGQSVKRVDMDLAIAGDGRLIGVSVQQGGAELKQCVESKVRQIRFPSSSSPRTAASWYFELY